MSSIPEGAVSSNGSESCLISCLATPRASRNALCGWHDGRLKVALAAPPVDGEANKALIKFFAEIMQLPRSAVSVHSGATGRRKVLALRGMSCEQVSEILNSLIKE